MTLRLVHTVSASADHRAPSSIRRVHSVGPTRPSSAPSPRARRDTVELSLDARNLVRRNRAFAYLTNAGLRSSDAMLCINALESGAMDAFARSYAYVTVLGVDAASWRNWLATHGYHDVVGGTENQPKRNDVCATCGKTITAKTSIRTVTLPEGRFATTCRDCPDPESTPTKLSFGARLRELLTDWKEGA